MLSQLAKLVLEGSHVILERKRVLFHIQDGQFTALGPCDLCHGCNGLSDVPEDPLFARDLCIIVVDVCFLNLPHKD